MSLNQPLYHFPISIWVLFYPTNFNYPQQQDTTTNDNHKLPRPTSMKPTQPLDIKSIIPRATNELLIDTPNLKPAI